MKTSRKVLCVLTCVAAVFTLAASASAQTVNLIYSFPKLGAQGGSQPIAGLILDPAGNLYGTAYAGGNLTGCSNYGCGTVFELSPGSAWNENVLHTFSLTQQTSGIGPMGNLVSDASGNLYGTTSTGGNGGVVFQLSPLSTGGWRETILHAFQNGPDGGFPKAGLIRDSAGNLYGTTTEGGNQPCRCGVVFELTPTVSGGWKYSVLHRFSPWSDGSDSLGNLVMDAAGSLYGTSFYGGDHNSAHFCNARRAGCGTVFELTPTSSGWQESVIHAFTGGDDGRNPAAGLILDAAGNLYGTTFAGGSLDQGVVFELTLSNGTWNENVLYSFTALHDGHNPAGSLIFDSAGNLWGTTSQGGQPNWGTVFRLTQDSNGNWNESFLYAFGNGIVSGSKPVAGLVMDSACNFFGTTSEAGKNGSGAVFEVTP